MTAIFLCENSNVKLEWAVTDGAQDNDEVEIEVASGHRILTCKSTSLKGGKRAGRGRMVKTIETFP